MPDGNTAQRQVGTAAAPGTLTFLFSDLREYTQFVESHGDDAATALIADYRRLVRAEVARTGGGEVKTEGDSFYVVFTSARAALRCGIAILTEAERQTRTNPERPIKVGIGINAGEPLPHEGQYVGSAVNVAARLAQQAGPGELLVTEVVRALLRTSGLPPMETKDAIQLKGIADPPRVYAVSWRPAEPAAVAAAPGRFHGAGRAPIGGRVLSPIVVGRVAELDALESLLRDALARTGRTALVAGEAGVGKSAFMRRFAERAAAAGARYLAGECTEVEARRPFGPFVEILRAAFRELSASSLEQELRVKASELLQLFPELARRDIAIDPLAEPERYRVHAAFAHVLGQVAAERPLVVAIEDLHWGDEATLELVPFLARKIRDQRLLLVATYRSDELNRLHPLRRVLADLARARLAEEIHLRRLSLEESGEVIRAALGLESGPWAELRAAIHERCEGNPFFIEEVLKALVESGDLYYRDGEWHRDKDIEELAIPDSVRDAVQQRLGGLNEEARLVIQYAAVIGNRFDFELLRAISGLSEAALVRALRAAVEAQLVVEEAEDRYAFRHALTRESILAELLSRERRLMHATVAEAIERMADASRRAEELAYHFDEAKEHGRAFRYYAQAAHEASSAFAFARAKQLFERAIEIAPPESAPLAALHLKLSSASLASNDLARAIRAAEEAQRLYRSAGDISGTGLAMVSLARLQWYRGDTAAAAAAAADATRMLEPLAETAELAGALAETARLAMLDGRDDEAIPAATRALELARRTANLSVEVDTLTTLGSSRVHLGDAEGLELLREALRGALEHDLVGAASRAYNNIGISLNLLDRPYDEMRRHHDEYAAYARRHGTEWDTVITWDARYALTDGEWDRALQVAKQAQESIWAAGARLLEAFIRAAREGPAGHDPSADAARRRLLAAGDAQWVASAASWTAQTKFVLGDHAAVLEAAQPLAPLCERGYESTTARLTEILAMRAAERLGERALEAWTALALRPTRYAHQFARAAQAYARAHRTPDPRAAAAELREAIHLLDQRRQWMSRTVARQRLAELLLELGERDAAAAALPAVLPYWRKAKATWYLGELRKWAEGLGLPFPES